MNEPRKPKGADHVRRQNQTRDYGVNQRNAFIDAEMQRQDASRESWRVIRTTALKGFVGGMAGAIAVAMAGGLKWFLSLFNWSGHS